MYKCRSCGRNILEWPQHEKYTPEQKETILSAYQERHSMHGIGRIFGVACPTLIEWHRNDRQLHLTTSPQETLAAALLPPETEEVLCLDETWSYVGSKNNPLWIWIVLCRRIRQVVAWVGGA